MILNIIDKRKRPYRWRCIDATIEPTWHDNTCADCDHADEGDPGAVVWEGRTGIALAEAVVWAAAKPYAVTLYLYDEGRSGASTKRKGAGNP
jgi:hypothetical protein